MIKKNWFKRVIYSQSGSHSSSCCVRCCFLRQRQGESQTFIIESRGAAWSSLNLCMQNFFFCFGCIEMFKLVWQAPERM